jgi:cytochrome c biogenesis protein CcmG/thiol:disulfide interchange protein DsbE
MTMRRLLFILPLLALATLAVAFALGLNPSRDPRAIDSPLVGKRVAGFVAPGLADGQPESAARDLRIEAYRNQVVAINFFASWCLPCRAEHAFLKKLAAEAGIPVLGLTWKDKKRASLDFLDELGSPYSQVGADENGRIGITSFGITGVPETFIIDQKGIIRARIPGPLTNDIIEAQLLPLIKDLQK